MAHVFLSDAWIQAVSNLQHDYLDRVTVPTAPIRLNGTIRDVPFADQPVEMHLDTSSGIGVVQPGHLASADVTVNTDYGTARDLFVGGDPQAIMTAFLDGRIVVQGDLTKLVGAITEANAPDSIRDEVAARVRDLTVMPD